MLSRFVPCSRTLLKWKSLCRSLWRKLFCTFVGISCNPGQDLLAPKHAFPLKRFRLYLSVQFNSHYSRVHSSKFFCVLPLPGGEVGGVPLLAAFVPDLPAEAALDVGERLHPAVGRVQDLPEEGDVGDGQAERVDLAQPLLVREGGNVQAELLEGSVDAAGAEPRGGGGGGRRNRGGTMTLISRN